MGMELVVLLSVVWVSSLAFAAYMFWLLRYSKSPTKEVEALRTEMNALAMAVGLRQRQMPQGPIPPTMGIR